MDGDGLGAFPFVVVRLGCRHCKRTGSYRLNRLAAKYSAEITMPELLDRRQRTVPIASTASRENIRRTASRGSSTSMTLDRRRTFRRLLVEES